MPELLSNSEASYIAGFVDGEGCFSTAARQFVTPYLEVTNTDKDTLDWMQRITECGSVYKVKTPKGRPQRWKWSASVQPAADVVHQLIPFLRTKRMQAHCFCAIAAFRRLPQASRKRLRIVEFALAAFCTAEKLGGRKAKTAVPDFAQIIAKELAAQERSK